MQSESTASSSTTTAVPVDTSRDAGAGADADPDVEADSVPAEPADPTFALSPAGQPTGFDTDVPDDEDWFATAFTYYVLEPTPTTELDAGFSMYVAAWPFMQTYPGASFQSGLPSTWLTPANLDGEERELYSTIEGGLGWWNDTRFATETPKFIMGGVSIEFTEWANGPGAGAGTADVDRRDWDVPQGKYGVAQLANNVLWAPDGLNLEEGTNGELFGYGYHPLPLIDAQTTSLGRDVVTGDNSWTLFLSTGNFQGPVSFFIPNFFTKPAIGDDSLEGLFFDTSGTDSHRAIGLETQVIPAAQATVDGVAYARITPTQYPATDDESSVILHRISSYSDVALSDAVRDWFDGGPAPSGELAADGTHVGQFEETTAGQDVWWTFLFEGLDENEEYLVDVDALGTLDQSDPTTFRYRWDLDVVDRLGDSFVLPEYYRLETVDGETRWRPVPAADVPVESGLLDHVFPESGVRNDGEPFTTPDLSIDGPWSSPGPSSEEFTAELGDGSVVTYRWYRFIDQPAIRYWGFSDEELAVMQERVEAIHREWGSDRTYLAPPETGELANLDPAILVEPPAGMEVGYVPIVTRQALAE